MNDPARVGVRAGRLVGVVTAAVTVVGVFGPAHSAFGATGRLLAFLGVTTDVSVFGTELSVVTLVTAGNVVVAASARYAACYVVGSLVGVVYDWLETPGVGVLFALAATVGCVDGAFATLDLGVPFGIAHLLAWLAYVPAYVRLAPDDPTERDGPVRLG
ncbi:MAG: hypothetical protein ABEI99_00785 [Halobaculum sp.]